MKKIGLICSILVLALGALGVGYAAWTDTVNVTGDMTTGSVCWEFTTCNLIDEHEPTNPGGDSPTSNPDYTCNVGFVADPVKGSFWPLDKDVSWGEQSFSVDKKTLAQCLSQQLQQADLLRP